MKPVFRVITLSNGLKVGNFNSPHDFDFEDGSTLSAHDPEYVREYSMEQVEGLHSEYNGIKTITREFMPTKSLLTLIDEWEEAWGKGLVDIVIVPMPVMLWLKKSLTPQSVTPFRTINQDRVTKKASIDTFIL